MDSGYGQLTVVICFAFGHTIKVCNIQTTIQICIVVLQRLFIIRRDSRAKAV